MRGARLSTPSSVCRVSSRRTPRKIEIRGADVAHRVERDLRGEHERREADRRERDVDDRAGRDPEHRREPGAPPLVDAAADDVQHCGPGDREQRERGEDEERVRRRATASQRPYIAATSRPVAAIRSRSSAGSSTSTCEPKRSSSRYASPRCANATTARPSSVDPRLAGQQAPHVLVRRAPSPATRGSVSSKRATTRPRTPCSSNAGGPLEARPRAPAPTRRARRGRRACRPSGARRDTRRRPSARARAGRSCAGRRGRPRGSGCRTRQPLPDGGRERRQVRHACPRRGTSRACRGGRAATRASPAPAARAEAPRAA